ncbi:MAG TPA: hypothetical protein VFI24_24455 [Pyrinomonadaceae bacterium]|nr:hypothetical protein [Pyrinomonadaceae bacterium]
MKHLTLLAGCLILLAASSPQVFAQRTAGNVVDSGVAQPIKLTTVSVNTGSNRRGSWLTEPLVQVENTSRETIQYMVIEITLPDAKPGTKGFFMLAYGQIPGKTLPNVPSLMPGMKVDLSVDRNACDVVKSNLLKSGIRPPTGSRVSTRINGVVFGNGTAWFDGLLHVADPRDPMRWNVVENLNQADLAGASPLFSFTPAAFRPKLTPAPCWKRLGTQWVDCCGFQFASAIMVQVWGGLFEPFPMSTQCEDGSTCEWIKQVGCSSDPEGGTF